MKTLILTFITLTLTSCGAIKSLNRIKSNASTSEKIIANEKTSTQQSYTHAITLSDSTESLYKIIIYPLDTFQFSIQKGFKGKAVKVELTALTRRRSHQTDTTAITTLSNYQNQLEFVKKNTNKSTVLAKTIKRNNNHWLLNLGLALAFTIGILWIYKKLRR